jgi:hypothetical protein
MPTSRIERIALNESAFRDLNENLEQSVHRGRADSGYAGFVCECGDGDCEMTVRLELAAYEHIRRDPCLFFVVAGHELPEAEAVVERNDGYVVVRKMEEAADIVEETDPRS